MMISWPFKESIFHHNKEDDDLALFLDQENTCSIDDIIVLSPQEIDNASIQLNSGGTRSLASHAKSKLRILQAWNTYLMAKNNVVFVDWTDSDLVNHNTHNEFHIGTYKPGKS